jgi:hypothetical protein
MGGRFPPEEQLRQGGQHIFMVELSGNDQRQALPAEFVDDGEDVEFPAIVGATLDEVVCPYVPRIFRPELDAGTVIEPKPAAFPLPLRHLETFTPPYSLRHL